MAYEKRGNKWIESKIVEQERSEEDVYDLKETLRAKKNFLARMNDAGVVQAEAGIMGEASYHLSQGISIWDQLTKVIAQFDDVPNVPKPEKPKDLGAVEL